MSEATDIIDRALVRYHDATIISKAEIVDVFLDVRLAVDDPVAAAAVDEALASFTSPSLVEWPHARATLITVRHVVVAAPLPAAV